MFDPARRYTLAARIALALAILLLAMPEPSPAAKTPTHKAGLHDARRLLERSQVLMGAMCTIRAEGLDSNWTSRSVSEGFAEIDRMDSLLNSWRTGSEIARLNAVGAEIRTACSPDLYAAIDSAITIAAETEGAFDPTVEPLIRAWGVRDSARVPTNSELNDARSRVGWKMVQIESHFRTVRFRRDGMGLDLGALARGYAIDQVAEMLRVRRLARVMLEFGDEAVGFSDGESWMVEVTDPANHVRPALRLVLHRGAVSTAGGGSRGAAELGRDASPLFNQDTGRPLDTEASVTVVARSATRAAALAAALLVMGREHAETYVADHRDVGAVWLESHNGLMRGWNWNLPMLSTAPGATIDWRP